MPVNSQPMSRRERNKQDKLARITAAASELFSAYGIDEVTTQQVADKADIGTGTLFLYAKTKGELLLLVQNEHYAKALDTGRAAAAREAEVLDAVLAIVRPIVECNRRHVENGRTYLREMAFGDPSEPHHATALAIAGETEGAIAAVLARQPELSAEAAATLAHVVSAIMFASMASSANAELAVDEIVQEIRRQVALILVSHR